jgi:hypothetical protein
MTVSDGFRAANIWCFYVPGPREPPAAALVAVNLLKATMGVTRSLAAGLLIGIRALPLLCVPSAKEPLLLTLRALTAMVLNCRVSC